MPKIVPPSEVQDYIPPPQDWAGFRAALYSNPEFLSLIDTSPIASELSTTLWNQDATSARKLWAWLKANNKITASLEASIESAAINANLAYEWAAVTGDMNG